LLEFSKEFSVGVTMSRKTFTWLCFLPQLDGIEEEEEEGGGEGEILFQQSGAPSYFSYEVQKT
jgi:hypothetical protein